MSAYDYKYAPPYPQRNLSYSGGNLQSRPPPRPHRTSVSSFGGAPQNAPVTIPVVPMQNPPYYPPTQQMAPPRPDYAPQQPLASYGPPPQAFQQVARIPSQQLAYHRPSPQQQLAYPAIAPEPFVGASLHPSSANSYDRYEMALAPHNGRRHSSSSSHSRRSRHSSYSDDASSDDSNRSGRSRTSRAHKKKKKETEAKVAALDRRPSYGDSVLLVYNVLKGAVTGKRD